MSYSPRMPPRASVPIALYARVRELIKLVCDCIRTSSGVVAGESRRCAEVGENVPFIAGAHSPLHPRLNGLQEAAHSGRRSRYAWLRIFTVPFSWSAFLEMSTLRTRDRVALSRVELPSRGGNIGTIKAGNPPCGSLLYTRQSSPVSQPLLSAIQFILWIKLLASSPS